jgi:hypothetical protein
LSLNSTVAVVNGDVVTNANQLIALTGGGGNSAGPAPAMVTVTDGGTWSDTTLGATVTLTPQAGLTQNPDGTWTWSGTAVAGAGPVTITATDSQGASTSIQFWLTANQVFIVNTTADTSAVNPMVGAQDSNGNISLRSAIQAVNAAGASTPALIAFDIPTSDPGYTAPTSVAITNVSLSNNVATLTTSGPIPVALGQTVIVAGLSNSLFNGDYQVTAKTLTSFSYALVHADLPSTNDSGTASDPGQFTLMPQSALPAIQKPVIIDGYTQPGSSPNTMPNQGLGAGDNAIQNIILEGNSSQANGLDITGGATTVQGLDIQSFPNAIHFTTTGNVIAGNYLSGTANAGVLIDNAANNTIGGVTPGARNIVGGETGILMQGSGATGNQVQGNYIGTDGIQLINAFIGVDTSDGANNNIVGGTATGAGNVISPLGWGIILENDTSGSVVQGNYIGTDATGNALPAGLPTGHIGGPDKRFAGIAMNDSASDNTIGGITSSARNVISGWFDQVRSFPFFPGSMGNLVEGNYIGTNAAGTAALRHPDFAILDPASQFPIGVVGSNLTISGNLISGVELAVAAFTGDEVQGNLIGTDWTGTQPIPNGVGVQATGNDNLIGGTTPGAGNIIAFNDGPGVSVGEGSGDQIEGNSIRGNQGPGVWVQSDPFGAADPFGAFSEGLAATGISIQRNSIYGNGGLGIALGNIAVDANGNPLTLPQVQANPNLWDHDIPNNQVVANDSLGHVVVISPQNYAAGANYFQNYPVLSSASSSSTDTSISGTFSSGTLDGTPNTPPFEPDEVITLDFYANPTPDPSGYGQGQTYLGSTTVTTDGNGNAAFVADLPVGNLAGQWITATATDPSGNTSEFSKDIAVPTASAAGPYTMTYGGSLTLSASGSDPDGDALTYSWTINGQAGAATGASPTLTWSQLQALGVSSAAPFSVSVTASDGSGSSATSATVQVTVNKATPTLSQLSAPTVTVGTGNASISGTISDGTLIPTGNVSIQVGSGAGVTAVINSNGTFSASVPVSSLAVGAYPVTFSYAGDGNFNGASASATLDVTYGVTLLSNLSHAQPAGTQFTFQVEPTNAAGNNLSASVASVTALGFAPASNPAQITPVPDGGAFTPLPNSKKPTSWQYILQTSKSLAAGTYVFYFTIQGDPVTHSLTFQVK